jgi:dihydrofolate reductase
MGKVLVDLSMSLDGYISGPNESLQQPLGDGGQGLHDWMSRTTEELMQGGTPATIGAMVTGRRTYDLVDGWGGSHPLYAVPVFVLTHHIPHQAPKGATPFTFVTDGIASALAQAKAAAGDNNVYVVGGAKTAQQCLQAGLVDELLIHLVPVLLGEGIRLFERMGTAPVELEQTWVRESPGVTHLRFRLFR